MRRTPNNSEREKSNRDWEELFNNTRTLQPTTPNASTSPNQALINNQNPIANDLPSANAGQLHNPSVVNDLPSSPNAALFNNLNQTVLQQPNTPTLILRRRSSSNQKEKELPAQQTAESSPSTDLLSDSVESPTADTLPAETPRRPVLLRRGERPSRPKQEKIVESMEVLEENPVQVSQREFNEDQKAWAQGFTRPGRDPKEVIPFKASPPEVAAETHEKIKQTQEALKQLQSEVKANTQAFDTLAEQTSRALQNNRSIAELRLEALEKLILEKQS